MAIIQARIIRAALEMSPAIVAIQFQAVLNVVTMDQASASNAMKRRTFTLMMANANADMASNLLITNANM